MTHSFSNCPKCDGEMMDDYCTNCGEIKQEDYGMNEKPNNGGPAFPDLQPMYDCGSDLQELAGGMSLRDYFAGQALSGIMAVAASPLDAPQPQCDSHIAVWAANAYAMADAMIAARKEPSHDAK